MPAGRRAQVWPEESVFLRLSPFGPEAAREERKSRKVQKPKRQISHLHRCRRPRNRRQGIEKYLQTSIKSINGPLIENPHLVPKKYEEFLQKNTEKV